MAEGKGGSLGNIASAIGNAVIPETMNAYRERNAYAEASDPLRQLLAMSGIGAAPQALPQQTQRKPFDLTTFGDDGATTQAMPKGPTSADQTSFKGLPSTSFNKPVGGNFTAADAPRAAQDFFGQKADLQSDVIQKLMGAPLVQRQMAALQMGRMFAPPVRNKLAKDEVITDELGNVVASNIQKEPFKPTNMQKPGTNDVKVAQTQAEYDAYARQGYAQAGNTVPGAPAAKETWRTLSPDDVKRMGLPAGNYQASDTGQVRTVTTPQTERIPQGFRLAENGSDLEFIPGGPADPNTQSQTQKGQLSTIEAESKALLNSLDEFDHVIDGAEPKDWVSAYGGGLSVGGRKLTSAWTNSALMAKGDALYKLGVLSGPDMTILQSALPNPSSTSGAMTGKDAYKSAIADMRKLVNARLGSFRESLGTNRTSPQPTTTEPQPPAPDAAPPPGAPPGAKLGKDPSGAPGWYTPDPLNPGKFIKW